IGPLLRVEPAQRAGLHHLLAQAIVFLLRAVAPHHAIGLGQRSHPRDPVDQAPMPDVFGNIQGLARLVALLHRFVSYAWETMRTDPARPAGGPAHHSAYAIARP